jgi:hypothetical protein
MIYGSYFIITYFSVKNILKENNNWFIKVSI